MPELPEVETVARGLQCALPARRILSIRLGKTDFIEDPAALEREIPGSCVQSVRRFGKFMLIDLQPREADEPKFALQVHLGMTGRMVVCSPDEPVLPHTHVFIALDDGREVRYTDPRRFGFMRIVPETEREELLQSVGLEPLDATEADFADKILSRRARIKALLLDQHVFGGMGNIYTDESLWRARINPKRLGANLSSAEIHQLYKAMRQVLTEAISSRGSTISNFVDSYGLPGNFQQRHRVYDREGKKCFRCGTLIRREIVAGRSSYFCPRCQPAPRVRKKKTVAKPIKKRSGGPARA
ncbi:MAG TPA: bifunctional DNA-formamidopyrimidine glycosylase/DNA-(apurinic or apyrimidinic site) lyase [Candidatus Dormibacteraeota bacterium]|nr:bifunctional DNA-formamidopyrimidine glycosylase/DNA-(apurinic or apyrimidinic site) lyase [Candidatus Dormibacteraeota bacterium]